jgi:hypothetical protein
LVAKKLPKYLEVCSEIATFALSLRQKELF